MKIAPANCQHPEDSQVPSTTKIYMPNGEAPKAGEIFKNPDLAATLKKLVEAEKGEFGKRTARGTESGPRSFL